MTWPPQTESDIAEALDARDVAESNRLDFKALVGDSDRARRDTAKDLASFAIDGGALLIGVSEDKLNRSFNLAPVDLHDVVERIEQIAGSRIDPPLVVRPREISAATEGLGYVWVDIPASPDAPHMVDGRYYGRGERITRKLSDADVLRLHSTRRSAELDVRDALSSLQGKDPITAARSFGQPNWRSQARPLYGHLYIVATPRSTSPGLAEEFVWDNARAVTELVLRSVSGVPGVLRNWVSLSGGGFSTVARAKGLSVTNLNGDGGFDAISQGEGCDVRVGTDGSIGYTVTRVTDPNQDEAERSEVLDGAVLASMWHSLAITRGIASATAFTGTWDLGLRITYLEGGTSMVFSDPRYMGFRRDAVAYDEPSYERICSATLTDLENPDHTVKRLTQPLLRALASWNRWTEILPELNAKAD
ncbi:hypothetical protein KK092_09660 [Curtobacterium flaccumfaciens pv. flaccumfaciens]|uniref:AlbA family DNA-binding domain-containing protein n=1 Tax=Curtobacterium flaccumfaciens TaxID=2035 RepID=UPI001BDF0F20|nr:ATP-binding protein [Curtobacterium flaccumfaciens]MBT1669647.1 hypothetical protein [Curtobacterium flaccumfaciens pv. flaccumfaciens]